MLTKVKLKHAFVMNALKVQAVRVATDVEYTCRHTMSQEVTKAN